MAKRTVKKRSVFNLLGCVLIISACTKSRPTKWPQGEEDAIFEKSEVSSVQMLLKTEEISSYDRASRQMHAVSEIATAPVKEVSGNERLKSLFKDLAVQVAIDSSQQVRFELSRKYVTAYKIIPQDSLAELSLLESQMALRKDPDIWVPLFQVPILAFGVVEKVKNDLGEETNTLRLRETEVEKATHIKFSTLPGARLPVGIPPDDSLESKQIFVRSRVDGNVLSRDEIERLLNIKLSQDGFYYVRHMGEKILFFSIRKFEALEKDLKDEIKRQDRHALRREDLYRCEESLKELVPQDLKTSCVAQLAYELEAKTVVAKRRAEDTAGTLGPVVIFEPGPATEGEDALIKIVYRSKPRETRIEFLDQGSLLAVDDLRGAEFFMRRTLQDSPNGFSYTFAGTSGRLEIVKFVFERAQVRVIRVDPLLIGEASSNTDQESLMSFPADYVKLSQLDEEGNPLASPRPVPALFDEKGALARIDWTRNSIPEVSSPLEYYQLGICFDGATERVVADVDSRMKESLGGMLNFSLVSTYAASRSVDCAGVYSEDYFDNVQKNYTFKERISFKLHKRTAQEEPWLSLPFEAQKRLGFGLFTYSKKKADSSGRVDVDGVQIPLPAVFDLRQGQKIKYVLAGLPVATDERSEKIRATIIKQTERVVKDINDAFAKALDSTPFARRQSVLELEVEDSPESSGKLGDLDKNYIYYISKATESGVIGLGGAHHNPRSGAVEAASVYLYGGNILAMVQDLREIAAHRKLYRDRIAGQVEAGDGEGGGSAVSRASVAKTTVAGMGQSLVRPQNRITPVLRAQSHRELKSFAGQLRHFTGSNDFTSAELRRSGVNLPAGYLGFREKLKTAIDTKAFGNEAKLARIFSGRQIPSALEKLQDSKICVYQVNALDLLEAADDPYLAEHDNIELLGEAWASTLAHELGHNLGLRHNFEASVDKNNWKFSENDSSERNYSSVMDYISDDLIRYDGFGPQDVASLRAAYAGLLEVNETAPKVESNGKVFVAGPAAPMEVLSNNFVRISDLLPALGETSWANIGESEIAALPIKKYKFCSDEDAGLRPTCNRFDMGTTPSEIVQAAVQSYKELYTLRNFAGNKLNFSIYSTGSYIGRLFARFIPIRQNLEETFFQLITSGKQEDYAPFLDATVEGLLFFNDVVRTPEASPLATDAERFTAVAFEDGEKIVESKVLRDLRLDANSNRLKVIGTEWDKAIALILLTERSMGFSRYEDISLRVAYPDIEKYLVEDPSNPLSLPTLGLLAEVLADNVQAVATTADGNRRSLPAEFKAESTELTRFMALDGAIFKLDVDGIEASDNNSSFFRVLSALKAPARTVSITKPGSSGDLQYWALPRAGVSEFLVDQGAMLGQVRKAGAAGLAAEMTRLFALEAGDEATALEQSIDLKLKALPETSGPRTMAELRPYSDALVDVASQLQALVGNPEVDQRMVSVIVSQQADRFANFAKALPTVGLALAALDGEALGLPLVDELKGSRTLEVFEGTTFRNVETLSSFFLMAHPSYRQ